MPRNRSAFDVDFPLEVTRQIDLLCDEFEAALKCGGGVEIEHYLDRVDPRGQKSLFDELASLALEWLRRAGVSDPKSAILAANPKLGDELKRVLAEEDGVATLSTDYLPQSSGKSSGLSIRCPHCHNMMELIVDASLMEIACSGCGEMFSLIDDAQDTRDATTVARVAHFELIERLGMGQFGTVWKARDTMLERTVALKIPRREQMEPLSVERFMREARAAAQLQHPNIVSTHEVGRDGDTFYIVIEYIRGVSLAGVLSDHRLGIRELVTLVIKLAEALEHAHCAGVIHRDIKPSNILVDDFGEPHLMDFGLAKRSENEITMTTEGAVLGTPAYMSPELARGEAHRVDGRSDIYSLGVVLFQLLSGELPFRGSTRMLLQKVINDDPPGPRTLDSCVPRDLDTICQKCLEKEPSRRFATAGELAADLRRYLAGQPVLARRLGKFGRTVRWVRRNRAVSSLLAATMTTLLVATAVSSYFAWQATNTLYDSLLQEIRLTREVRTPGYGETVYRLVEQARKLPTTHVDNDELRRQLVLSMGDFVAYTPRTITSVAGDFTAVCLSSDGQELIVGQNNGRLDVYDVHAGDVSAKLESLRGWVIAAAISAGGDSLVAGDQQGTIRLWRRVKQKWEVGRDFQMGEAPQTLVFSPDGERMAHLKDSRLEIWDLATGTKLRSLPTKSDWSMRNAAFDTSRQKLVAGYINERDDRSGWAMWNLDTGERSHDVDMPTLGGTYPNGIALSATGNRMAIGFDQELLTYGMTDFQATELAKFDSTIAVAFSPTNPYLAAANIRGWITVWDSTTNGQIGKLHLPTSTPSLIGLAFSADGKQLVASNAGRIQIWDLTKADERTMLFGHHGGVPCTAFQPRGRLLATGGKDGEVRMWNPFTGQPAGSVRVGEPIQSLAFSPDGKLLAVGSMGSEDTPHFRLLDVESTKVIYEAKSAVGEVLSLAWSEAADERYLAVGGRNGIAVWKTPVGLPVRTETILELKGGRCLATAVNCQSGLLVWAEENHLRAWDLFAKEQLTLSAPDMNQGWHGVALLPDGQSIIYVSKAGVAEIWNIKDDRRSESIGKPGTFNAPQIAISPNGVWFAALSQLDTVSVWHLPSGKHVFTLRPENAAVWSLGWDRSSERLAVGQSDGGLAVWHLPRIQKKLTESGLPW